MGFMGGSLLCKRIHSFIVVGIFLSHYPLQRQFVFSCEGLTILISHLACRIDNKKFKTMSNFDFSSIVRPASSSVIKCISANDFIYK